MSKKNPEVKPGDPNWPAFQAYLRGEEYELAEDWRYPDPGEERRSREERSWRRRRSREHLNRQRVIEKARAGGRLTPGELEALYQPYVEDREYDDLNASEWREEHRYSYEDWLDSVRAGRGAKKNPRKQDLRHYQDVLANLRAIQWLYWNTHWTTAGPDFYGTHLMLQRLYEGEGGGPDINGSIDVLGEKLVAYYGKGAVDPAAISARTSDMVAHYHAMGAGPAYSLLTAEQDLQKIIRVAWKANQGAGKEMSLGLDDYLMGLANERETAIYLLQQTLGGRGSANLGYNNPRQRYSLPDGSAASAWLKARGIYIKDPEGMGYMTEFGPMLGFNTTRGVILVGQLADGQLEAHGHPNTLPL